MTESKKKTTKKEVVEKSEAPVKKASKPKAKATKEKPEITSETLAPEEIAVVAAEPVKAVEEVEPVTAVDYGLDSEVKKEKRPKKLHAEPETEPEKETKVKSESRSVTSAEDFDWEAFESEEMRNSPKYKEP
jgi:hypothetical protein